MTKGMIDAKDLLIFCISCISFIWWEWCTPTLMYISTLLKPSNIFWSWHWPISHPVSVSGNQLVVFNYQGQKEGGCFFAPQQTESDDQFEIKKKKHIYCRMPAR